VSEDARELPDQVEVAALEVGGKKIFDRGLRAV